MINVITIVILFILIGLVCYVLYKISEIPLNPCPNPCPTYSKDTYLFLLAQKNPPSSNYGWTKDEMITIVNQIPDVQLATEEQLNKLGGIQNTEQFGDFAWFLHSKGVYYIGYPYCVKRKDNKSSYPWKCNDPTDPSDPYIHNPRSIKHFVGTQTGFIWLYGKIPTKLPDDQIVLYKILDKDFNSISGSCDKRYSCNP